MAAHSAAPGGGDSGAAGSSRDTLAGSGSITRLALPAKLTPQQVNDWELRAAAIHEAAHAVIARHFGYEASAQVFATPDPGPDDKSWTGRTMFYQETAGRRDSRLIALAGTVAEQIDDDPDLEALDIADWLEAGVIELSATDARMAGDHAVEDMEEAVMLVRHLWEEIEAEAELLAAGVAHGR